MTSNLLRIILPHVPQVTFVPRPVLSQPHQRTLLSSTMAS